MNDSQKRYTVFQISEYKSEAEQLDKKSQENMWFIYGCAALFICCSSLRGEPDIPQLADCIVGITQYAGLALGIDNLKSMIGNMAKKSGLENMATNLEYQIQNDELGDKEENNDKGRRL